MTSALCGTCAARLYGQRQIAALSLVLTALGVAGCALALRPPANPALLAILLAVCLLGLAERYVAVRLAIDEQLFERLAATDAPDLAALDQSLATLGMAPPEKAGRALAPRVAGALRLVRWHSLAVGLQLLLLAGAGALA